MLPINKAVQEITKSRIYDLVDWSKNKPWFDRAFLNELKEKMRIGLDFEAKEILAVESLHTQFVRNETKTIPDKGN
jgi:hypothetical protein